MPATDRLSTTDRALVAALAAWGGVGALPLLRRFGAQRARSLAGALAPDPPPDPLGTLREARAAQIAPDPRRVHPSWYVRALREESPAVRLVVVGTMDEPLRSALIGGLGLDPAGLAPDVPDDPEARAVALALWTERLVGDIPARDGDPPAVGALADLGPLGLYRVSRLCGLAKRGIVPGATILAPGPVMAERFARLRDRLAGPFDPRLIRMAENEWASAAPLGRHRLAGLGLATIGRLLAQAEPYRARWALQHVPYPIAKRLRVAASRPEASVRAVLDLEGSVLDEVLALLRDEGRVGGDGAPEGSPRP